MTQSLFYATDFIDRLENEVIPALRARFIVLTDRYVYSLMARAIIRGVDAAWIGGIYSAALVPDEVFYLRMDAEQLIQRVILSRGFDYWESGMGVFPGQDMYESFRSYQAALIAEFDRLSVEFHFGTVDGSMDERFVFAQLQANVQRVLGGDSRQEYQLQNAESRREYFDKVLEHASTNRVRGEGRQVTLPRENPASRPDWAFHPVAAHVPGGSGRNMPEHK